MEWEWLVTLATIEPDEVDYMDYVECAQRIVPMLKEKGCDLLVALTHMRMPNDTRLASEVPELHLILAGHDHHYEQKTVQPTNVTIAEVALCPSLPPFFHRLETLLF